MTRLSRTESQARTRLMILGAAREAFIAEGYARTSLEAVAEAAGFSKGAVYSNFESKEALFLELLEIKLTSEAKALEELVAAPASAPELLGALQAYLESHDYILDFTVAAIAFMTQLARGSPAAHRCAELYAAQRQAMERLIARLMRLARTDAPTDRAADGAAGLIAITLGLATQRGLDRGAISAALWARTAHDYLESLILSR
jgi:AcrR family transcriptional regulator